MTVGELQKLLSKYNPDEEIYVWRGNGHPNFDYTSDIQISVPYGSCSTNWGTVEHPLILGAVWNSKLRTKDQIEKRFSKK